MPILIVEKGPEQGQTVELKPGCRWVFGRDDTCEFTTADNSCSRRHFGIVEKDGRYLLKDLKSTHGTSVNGNQAAVKELSDGDTIVAGETVFSFGVDKSAGTGKGIVGKTIAGYQVFERIGRGGMGTVFRAKQVALDRDVALKVLSARYSTDKTFINRFFKEAQAAARLNNPNVVQVFDVREEKGLYLISLEMMDGGTVQDLATKEGQLPIERVLKIAREATKGLAYAEKKSIVHGDIKPDNLMMNADGHIKISDLGLARDAGEMSHQGEEGVFGTPHFISPEQAQGKAVDSRSDIYSLGATLYRLISGSTPFSSTSVREIIMKQINDEPPALKDTRPDCPEDLADLVSVMMAKDADDRFESAEALLSAVESLGDTGTLSGQSSTGKKAALVVLALAIIGGVAFFLQKEDPVKPNQGNPLARQNGANNGKPTAEQLAERERMEKEKQELQVKDLRTNAELFLADLKQNGKGDEIASLEALAAKFDEAIGAGPKTEEAKIVQAKKTALLAKIERLKSASEESLAAAKAKREQDDAAFARISENVTAASESGKFSEALAQIAASKKLLAEGHKAKALAPLRLEVLESARGAYRKFEDEVKAKLGVNDFSGAREAAATFRQSLVAGLSDPQTIDPDLKQLLTRVSSQEQAIDGRESAKKDADRKLDQSTVYSSLLPYYREFSENFDLDAKNAKIQALSNALQTEHFRPRIDRAQELMKLSLRFRDILVSEVSKNPGAILAYSGSRDIPSGKVVEADTTKFVVEKRSGKKETVEWAQVSAETLFKHLFRKVEISLEQRLTMAAWLIECVRLEDAEEVINDDFRNKISQGSPEERAQFAMIEKELKTEISARDLLSDVRRMMTEAKTASNVGHWVRIKARLDLFVRKYRGTRVYLLNSDGSSPLE